MDIRKPAALVVIIVIAAVAVFVLTVSLRTWQGRTNQTVTNQPPAVQQQQTVP